MTATRALRDHARAAARAAARRSPTPTVSRRHLHEIADAVTEAVHVAEEDIDLYLLNAWAAGADYMLDKIVSTFEHVAEDTEFPQEMRDFVAGFAAVARSHDIPTLHIHRTPKPESEDD